MQQLCGSVDPAPMLQMRKYRDCCCVWLQIRDKLSEERRSLAEVIREEFAEKLVIMEEENRRMKVEVAEVRARLRLEVERLSREKEEELAEVHQR